MVRRRHNFVNWSSIDEVLDLVVIIESFDGGLLNVPNLSKGCADSYHERSFAFAGLPDWNALP